MNYETIRCMFLVELLQLYSFYLLARQDVIEVSS